MSARANAGRPDPGWLDRLVGRVFPPLDALGGRGTITAPLLIVLAVSLGTAGVTRVWGWDLVFTQSPPATLRTFFWVIAFISPVIALAKGAVLALVGWSVLALLGRASRLRAVLSAVLYGEAVLALQGPLLVLTLAFQGGVKEGGLPAPTGLNAFVDPASPVLLAFAQGVTPVHAAWVAFLALALAACAGGSRASGATAAGFLWVLTTGLGVLRAVLTGGMA
jgi:hypothetical protein